jgi:BirA family biotin operon repressor/biotin-[acetyl-CoA-carboxylase] ligase
VTGLPVELKWPNDVVIGRPWRKLGGVLSEAASAGVRVEAIVIGIGLNLQRPKFPSELADKATSLEVELGRPVDSARLVVEVLGRLRDVMEQLHGGHGDAVCRAWRDLGAVGLGGAAVRWRENGEPRRGRARDLDADGALIVDVDGRPERLVAGEVLWESLSRE